MAYRTTKTLFDRPYTVRVVYHETLFLGQLQGMTPKLKKATQALREISTRLEDDVPALQFAIDHAALQALAERRFRKTLLFTDQARWTDEQILAAYRGRAQMERAIRELGALAP